MQNMQEETCWKSEKASNLMSHLRDHTLLRYSEFNVVNFSFRACEEFRLSKLTVHN